MAVIIKNGASAPDPHIVLNITHWGADTVDAWDALVTSKEETVSFRRVSEFLAEHRAIEEWEYETDPTKAENIYTLSPYVIGELMKGVGQAVSNIFRTEENISQ